MKGIPWWHYAYIGVLLVLTLWIRQTTRDLDALRIKTGIDGAMTERIRRYLINVAEEDRGRPGPSPASPPSP